MPTTDAPEGIASQTNASAAAAPKIIAVLEDLLFTVKINEAAKRASVQVRFVKSEVDALQQAAESPRLIILDLNCTCVDPLQLIRALKSSARASAVPVIGYVSHIQGELKLQAQQAGCNMVMARSAFSQNLQQIMQRYSAA